MAEAARDSRTGELLNAAYELHELLERDATYDIYRATDRRAARAVKVKLLRPEFALQSNVVQRFLRAPKTLTGLRHPNVSRVLAVESDETGIPFVVEEHVEGEPLARTIARFPAGVPLDVALRVLSPVASALAAAHELGVVHGRLDPDHILLREIGGSVVPKIVRFGSVDACRAPAAAKAERLAPELRDGRASPDPRSDMWALGALIYETLCGQPPQARAGHEPLDARVPGLPAELSQIVERCLARTPADRPARASAVCDLLGGLRERPRGTDPESAPAHLRAKRPKDARASRAAPVPRVEAGARAPETAVAKPAAPAPRTRVAVGRNTAVGRKVELPSLETAIDSLAATMPAALAKEDPTVPFAVEPDEIVLEIAVDEEVAECDDEGPEITLEAAAPSLAPEPSRRPDPKPSPKAIMTLSDVAAAFGPIEGADRIGQADAPSRDRAADEDDADDALPARATVADKTKDRKGKGKGFQLLPSRKQLIQGNTPAPARALSDEQMRQLRKRTQKDERRRGRVVAAFLFFLFAFGLLFAVPLLVDPSRTKAHALFGERAHLVAGGFAILSVIALVRTWTLQIQARPVMLRPVTLSLKVVTATVCVLAATFFVPAGALGPAEAAARGILPWAGSAFYLFLAIYGLLMGVRQASANALYAMAVVALYCSSFFGSYRVLATTVLVKKPKLVQQQPAGAAIETTVQGKVGKVDFDDMADHATGSLKHDAGADEKVIERTQVGASETEDMQAVDQLEQSRKSKSTRFDQLGKKMNELIH